MDPPATADGGNPTLRYQFSGKADEKAVDRNEAKWIGFEKSGGKDEGLMVDIEPNWLFLFFCGQRSLIVKFWADTGWYQTKIDFFKALLVKL